MITTLQDIMKFQHDQQTNETTKKGKFWKFKYLTNIQKSDLIKDFAYKISHLNRDNLETKGSTLDSQNKFDFYFKDLKADYYLLIGIAKDEIKTFNISTNEILKDENDRFYIMQNDKKKLFTKMRTGHYRMTIYNNQMNNINERAFLTDIFHFENEINRLYNENNENKNKLELLENYRIGLIGELYIQSLLERWKIPHIYDPKSKYDFQLINQNLEIKTARKEKNEKNKNRFKFNSINLNKTHFYDYFIFIGLIENDSKYFILKKENILTSKTKKDNKGNFRKYFTINNKILWMSQTGKNIYQFNLHKKHMITLGNGFNLELDLIDISREY